ncbi:MAG: iron complex transport system substrate-binding protein, partial [Sphingomonadales bacterium]|nr:iron complex transport system substrate-binding protein [Sphingomonadales bacterium]
MRIVSLVPHATELLFALGLGDQVVGVTHECDHPTAALLRPHVTRDLLPAGLSSGEIDAAVREHTEQGGSIYGLDAAKLRELAPDLIVTQALCAVCAVSADDVRKIAEELPTKPKVVSLDPTTIGETMADVRTIAQATGVRQAAVDLVARQRARIDAVAEAVADARPVTVAALEWFDPVFVAGHWTPQLIELAGGFDVLGMPGEHSVQSTWEAVAAAKPEVVVCMPCGYDAARSLREAQEHADALRAVGAREVLAVDASS